MITSPLNKALREIYFRIPNELLEAGFVDDRPGCQMSNTSLDDRIMTLLIRPRVLVDCDLIGGRQVNVDLAGLVPSYATHDSQVYSIPKSRTNGRSIVSVLSVAPMTHSYGTGHNTDMNGNPLVNLASRGMDAVAGGAPFFDVATELVAENTVMLKYRNPIQQPGLLRCVIQNEENMNNLPIRTYPLFSQLVTLATQAYLYNRLYIRVDQAYLQSGQGLGSFKDRLDEYSSAEEDYQELLTGRWAKMQMFDEEPHRRLIKSQIAPFL